MNFYLQCPLHCLLQMDRILHLSLLPYGSLKPPTYHQSEPHHLGDVGLNGERWMCLSAGRAVDTTSLYPGQHKGISNGAEYHRHLLCCATYDIGVHGSCPTDCNSCDYVHSSWYDVYDHGGVFCKNSMYKWVSKLLETVISCLLVTATVENAPKKIVKASY